MEFKDAKDLVVLLVYVAPGFVATSVYCRVYPIAGSSEFRRFTWSAICGALIWSTTSFAGRRWPSWGLRLSQGGFPGLKLVSALLLAGFVFGVALAVGQKGLDWISAGRRWLSELQYDPQSTWALLACSSNWAVVHLSNGVVYRGFITEWSTVPGSDTHDFLLARAVELSGSDMRSERDVVGRGVYLNTRDALAIEFWTPPANAADEDVNGKRGLRSKLRRLLGAGPEGMSARRGGSRAHQDAPPGGFTQD